MDYEPKQPNLCSQCYKNKIHNQHFKLCIYCNKKRLNEGKANPNPKTKRSTPRTKAIGVQKGELKKKIADERGLLCAGCNNRHGALTLSHTIPVSLRKDLELEKENCHLECISCHTVWEHGTPQEKLALLNYQEKIDYIQAVDPQYYERRFNLTDD